MKFASKKEEHDFYEQEATEEEYLNWYKNQNQAKYEKPSVTVDMVLMCYEKPADQLKILLIQRKGHPYQNSWALPGGFVDPGESTGASVIRETKEETGMHIS